MCFTIASSNRILITIDNTNDIILINCLNKN